MQFERKTKGGVPSVFVFVPLLKLEDSSACATVSCIYIYEIRYIYYSVPHHLGSSTSTSGYVSSVISLSIYEKMATFGYTNIEEGMK